MGILGLCPPWLRCEVWLARSSRAGPLMRGPRALRARPADAGFKPHNITRATGCRSGRWRNVTVFIAARSGGRWESAVPPATRSPASAWTRVMTPSWSTAPSEFRLSRTRRRSPSAQSWRESPTLGCRAHPILAERVSRPTHPLDVQRNRRPRPAPTRMRHQHHVANASVALNRVPTTLAARARRAVSSLRTSRPAEVTA